MRQYPQVKAGEWVSPRRKGYKMQCCDCGLVHLLEFRIHNGHIQMRGFRDERATAAVRRWRNLPPKLEGQ